MSTGPILVVDDDSDDMFLLEEACKELQFKHPLMFFYSAEDVLKYLRTERTAPFLIISDVNLPGIDGFELKKKILEDTELNYKTIPFVFWSTSSPEAYVQKAYDLAVNGFFLKENNFEKLKELLVDIVNYWSKSQVPNG